MTPSSNLPQSIFGLVAIFLSMALLTFIAMNLGALRQRDTNKKSALATVFALIIWLMNLAFVGTIVFSKGKEPPSWVLAVIGLGFFVALAFIIVSSILAIIGLIECVRDRHEQKGFKRAIGSLVSHAFMILAILVGVIYTAVQKSSTTSRDKVAENRPSAPSVSSVPLERSSSLGGESLINEEWNFRLDSPAGWVRQTPKPNANPESRVRGMLVRTEPPMSCAVATERLTREEPLQKFVTMLKETQGNGGLTDLNEGPLRVGGIDGWLVEYESEVGNGKSAYSNWIGQQDGVLYTMLIWGKSADRDEVHNEAVKLRSGFRLLKSSRSGTTTSSASVTAALEYTSSRFYWSFDGRGTVWTHKLPRLSEVNFAAEWGAHVPGRAWAFCVIPVWVGGDEALDLELVLPAMLDRLGLPYPSDHFYGVRDVRQDAVSGRAMAIEREVDGTPLLYRLRVLQGRGFVYLLAAWFDKRSDSLTDQLDEALDRVKFPQQIEPPDLTQFSENEKLAHALVYNGIGLELDRAGRTTEATSWFRRAGDMSPKDAVVAGNFVEMCFKLGQVKEAIAFLEANRENFAGNHKITLRLARAQYLAGEDEAGLKTMAALFESGYRDDTEFVGYATGLCDAGRTDDALAALDRYVKGRETNALKRLRATIHTYKREFDRAIELLLAAQGAAPNDTETTIALADAYFGAERYTETVAECEKLIAAGRSTAYVHRRKGFAEFSLKHYREAKVAFETALEKTPGDPDLKRILEHVSGMLGEGSNSAVKKPIEPVAIPQALLTGKVAEPEAALTRDYSAWYRRCVYGVECIKGREAKTTEHTAITIRDQRGVERFSSLEFRFDPLSEEIFVNSLLVKDESGKTMATGRVEDSYVVDDGMGEMATQHKILHVPVPALKPGFSLEYTVTRRDSAPPTEVEFRPHYFSRPLPVQESALYVKTGGTTLKWEGSPGVPKPQREGDDEYVWALKNPPIYRWEPLQVPTEKFLPIVWLGDAGTRWEAEVVEYSTLR